MSDSSESPQPDAATPQPDEPQPPTTEPSPSSAEPAAAATEAADESPELAPPPTPDGARPAGRTPNHYLFVSGDPDERVTVEVATEPCEVFFIVAGDRRRIGWRGDKASRISIELGGSKRAYLQALPGVPAP